MKRQSRTADVLIVGAGIVGAACAREFARQGLSVAVVESGAIGGGATAAAMGHLLVVDDAEFELSRRSCELWDEWLAESPGNTAAAEHQRCGTIWIAADEEELAEARRKNAWYAERGIACELLDTAGLARLEPQLRPGLAGGLRVPSDARVFPPKAAARWLQEARAQIIHGEVVALDGHTLTLADGRQLWGALVVVCAGLASQRWLPHGWLRPKKGQLAITQRGRDVRIQHELVDLGYLKKAHLADEDSVAFNLQPRPGGQILIGSSRQPGRSDAAIDHELLSRMLAEACAMLPALADASLLRCWTGLRPTSRDGLPLIGAHPALKRVWLACGHEGMGITTSLATAELLVDLSLGREPRIAASPFSPERLVAA
ncbi:FAD-dependent oxidoreductase [Paucibacter sp. R3-3]|uniref:FAD-dependent oxidoreductase n=1 Tax=Roseateles agri TaxID=3098619 RepID=A0ABU5DBF2_9BURK|nr:FAD-dependent oxidoreductase [Paucibacter sp. R3-3]MDY0743606.1 FAD-dependent oxidoreductase [Paucibacter sp. R3-3]